MPAKEYATRDLLMAQNVLDSAFGAYRENHTRANYLDLIQAQNNYRAAFKRAKELGLSADVQTSIYDSTEISQ